MTKMRIFIACADERLRIAMLLLLENEPGIFVVGITDRLQGLLLQLEASQPDVLLLEWELPFKSMAKLLTDVHKLEAPPKIVLLSSCPEEKEKITAAGADHFIAKDAPPDELLPFLTKVSYPLNL